MLSARITNDEICQLMRVFERERNLEVKPPLVQFQVVEPTPRVPADSRIEIRLQNGRSLVVRRGFDAEHVRALLMVVETAR